MMLATLQEWEDKIDCFRNDIKSLVRVLEHACKVVRPKAWLSQGLLSILPRLRLVQTGIHLTSHSSV